MVRLVLVKKPEVEEEEENESDSEEEEEEEEEEESDASGTKRKVKSSLSHRKYVRQLAFKKIFVAMLVQSPAAFVDHFWSQLPPLLAYRYPEVRRRSEAFIQ
jgi:hypothetical protein